MRRARASRRSDPRAPSTIFVPRSASRSAVASPIPLLAPVIATTFPSVPDISFSFPFTDLRKRYACRTEHGMLGRTGNLLDRSQCDGTSLVSDGEQRRREVFARGNALTGSVEYCANIR